MSKVQDDIFQVLHDYKIDVFGFVEDAPNKKIGLGLPFDLEPEFRVKLEAVLPEGWGLVFQVTEVPKEAKTDKDAKILEQKLIRMPNREERRRFEKSRK